MEVKSLTEHRRTNDVTSGSTSNPQEPSGISKEATWPSYKPEDKESSGESSSANDYFVIRDGVECAGVHIIVDLWGAENIGDLAIMEQAMRDAIDASNATLLHLHLHHFTENGGISGVAVLAESHISVHTWPERGFAAFDVFMCGNAEPEATIPVFQKAFQPEKLTVSEQLRGINISHEDLKDKQ